METRVFPESEFAAIAPKILYFGSPIALISTVNEDGSHNLAPISSFWALGWTMTLGLLTETQTLKNFQKHADCVVNLPTAEMWEQVERLAPLTGQNPVPEKKRAQFHYEPDKFSAGGFTSLKSELVDALRVAECPVQIEARMHKIYTLEGEPRLANLGGGAAVEVDALRIHVRKDLIVKDHYIRGQVAPVALQLPPLLRSRRRTRQDFSRRSMRGASTNDSHRDESADLNHRESSWRQQ